MTSQQKQMLQPLLNALASVRVPQQVEALWPVVTASFRIAGITIGNKPTSVAQAKTLAESLRKRYLD